MNFPVKIVVRKLRGMSCSLQLLHPTGVVVCPGKTTLLRLISGLEEPTEGRIYFDGELSCLALI